MLLKKTDPCRSKKLSSARARRLSRAVIIALVTGVAFVPGAIGLESAQRDSCGADEAGDGFVLRAPQNTGADDSSSQNASNEESGLKSEVAKQPPVAPPATAVQPAAVIAKANPSPSKTGTERVEAAASTATADKQTVPLTPQGQQAQPIDASWTKRSHDSVPKPAPAGRGKPVGPVVAEESQPDQPEMLPPSGAGNVTVDQQAGSAQQESLSQSADANPASQPSGAAMLPKARLASDGQLPAKSVAYPLKRPQLSPPGDRVLDGQAGLGQEGLPELPPPSPTLSQQVRPLNRDGFQPVRQEGKWVTRDMQNRLAPLRDPEPLPQVSQRRLMPTRENVDASQSTIPVSPIAGPDAANRDQPASTESDSVSAEPIATLPQQPLADQEQPSEQGDGPTVQEWIGRNQPAPSADQTKSSDSEQATPKSQAKPEDQSATAPAGSKNVASTQLGDKPSTTEHLSDRGAATDPSKSTPSMGLQPKDSDPEAKVARKPTDGAAAKPVIKSINEPLAPGKLTPIDGLKLAPVPKGSSATQGSAEPKQRAMDTIAPKSAKPLTKPAKQTPAVAGDLTADASVAAKPIQPTPTSTQYGALDYAGYPLKPIQVSRSVNNLRRTMERALNYFYNRPESANGRSNWGMMHSVMVYGAQTNVQVGRKRYNAIAWIAGNNVCRGQRLLTLDSKGLKARTGVGLQGHQGQFLAVLGMCNVPAEYPLYASGKAFSVADLIEAEQKGCKRGEELTFTLIGLSHYLDTDASWVAADGQRWDFERLIAEELRQPVVGAACGGTHRLMGYAHALRKRRAEGKPLTGQWLRAEKYVDDFVKYAFSLQNRDGSMSTRWFEGRDDNGDRDRKVQTTGHLVEWLLTVLPDDQLQDQRLVAAVSYLARAMGSDLGHEWSIGPKGHALRSMAMYHQRVFRAGTPWIPTAIAGRPVQRK